MIALPFLLAAGCIVLALCIRAYRKARFRDTLEREGREAFFRSFGAPK